MPERSWCHALGPNAVGRRIRSCRILSLIMIGLPLGASKEWPLSVKVGPEAYDSAARVKLGPFRRPLRKGICTSLSRVRLSDYGDGENALAEQLDCAFPARFRGQVM